ncbi:winged helix DNA-binding domain-containing protein [Rhodococcus sp. X156]|uniref:winged helix DNA-binding domain-containing protein n=1 Tax=Rhodococcus sp. X156 TaxID=2499145 RepID=UPI000FDA8066|nr:winged helix DNA-binding domain-containing protein [Rhodococcus sp. X156]
MATVHNVTLPEVALLRLAAQRLVGPRAATAAEAVRWMGAVQAQDHPGSLTSVALRTAAGTRADVVAALDAGEVVRTWPMRGTLHLLPAEDVAWMLPLLTPRVVAASAGRRRSLGLTEDDLDRAGQLAEQALAGGAGLARSELFAVWDDAGLATREQRGAHLLGYLAMTGTLVFGPTRNGQHLLVLARDWVRRPRRLEREEALGELALRYFRSHGPATPADLGRWAHLRVGDRRTGVELARPHLLSVEVAGADGDGTEHLMDPQTPERLAAAREEAEGVLLLPGFDELVLGYGDRRAQLDTEHAGRVVPGGNGMFLSTVVSAGRIVGTWRRAGRGAQQTISATPFTAFTPEVESALPRLYEQLP